MPKKRVLLAAISTFVVMFTVGGIWNSALMTNFYANHAPSNARAPEDVSMLFIVLGYLLLTVFMVFLFSQSFTEKPTLLEGFQFGALFGVIATLPVYLLIYAGWKVSLPMLLVDSGWHLAEQGIGGITLAAVMFSSRKDAPEPAHSDV